MSKDWTNPRGRPGTEIPEGLDWLPGPRASALLTAARPLSPRAERASVVRAAPAAAVGGSRRRCTRTRSLFVPRPGRASGAVEGTLCAGRGASVGAGSARRRLARFPAAPGRSWPCYLHPPHPESREQASPWSDWENARPGKAFPDRGEAGKLGKSGLQGPEELRLPGGGGPEPQGPGKRASRRATNRAGKWANVFATFPGKRPFLPDGPPCRPPPPLSLYHITLSSIFFLINSFILFIYLLLAALGDRKSVV